MQLRVINEFNVKRLLPMSTCIDLVRHAMILTAEGRAIQPIRTGIALPNARGLLGMMPGYTASPLWLGIKVTSVFPDNHGTQYGSHQGMVLLFETRYGRPLAVVNGRAVTYLRTAAASAVATDILARTEGSTVGILGYGDQAAAHVEAMSLVRTVQRFVVWGRSYPRAREFAARHQSARQVPVDAVSEIKDAVACDIVCTTTAAETALFESSTLHAGVHLNVVGSSIPSTAEIDSETVARSRFFVDYKESALALAGEFLAAKRAGVVTDDHILGSIGDVLIGRVKGREAPGDITIFKSLGMISEDLVSADHVYRRAQEEGIGEIVDL
jgi:ornithine cyclodeaminase/alanine dehydrogenase-like protein (mu-crystallin family)